MVVLSRLKKPSIKFDSGREVDYKRISFSKKGGEYYIFFKRGHRANNCPKNSNKSSDEKRDF